MNLRFLCSCPRSCWPHWQKVLTILFMWKNPGLTSLWHFVVVLSKFCNTIAVSEVLLPKVAATSSGRLPSSVSLVLGHGALTLQDGGKGNK